METQELITFASVVQHRSFSKAAQQLGYSQAAVTVQIHRLEQELGTPLFDRLGKRISLTHSGEVLYPQVVSILNSMQEASDSVRRDNPSLSGLLRIGATDSVCSVLLPPLLQQFRILHPQVEIQISTSTPSLLLEQLQRNELDLVYLVDENRSENWLQKVLETEEEAIFAVRREHPLADGAVHTLKELSEYPFVLTEKGASYRRVLETTLTEKGITIHPLLESDNTDLLLRMLPHEPGVAFLPRYVLQEELAAGSVCSVSVPECSVHVHLQLLHHKDKWISREMQAFFHCLQAEN